MYHDRCDVMTNMLSTRHVDAVDFILTVFSTAEPFAPRGGLGSKPLTGLQNFTRYSQTDLYYDIYKRILTRYLQEHIYTTIFSLQESEMFTKQDP